jgi:hypothetical protein
LYYISLFYFTLNTIQSFTRLIRPSGFRSTSTFRIVGSPTLRQSRRNIFTATPMSEVDKHLHPENATASTSSLSPICAQFPELKGLMEGNRTWAKGCKEEMPDLLPKLATGQVCLLLLLLRYIIPLLCDGAGRAGGNREISDRRVEE